MEKELQAKEGEIVTENLRKTLENLCGIAPIDTQKQAYTFALAVLHEQTEKFGTNTVGKRVAQRAERIRDILRHILYTESARDILTIYAPMLAGELCIPLNDEG